MNENAFLTNLTQFYQTALNWSAPRGYGVTGNTGTVVNTNTAFDTNLAMAQDVAQADYFGAMQGSFNNSFSFVNQAFQQQQNFLAPQLKQISEDTSWLGVYVAETQRMIAHRSTKRGLFSKIFG